MAKPPGKHTLKVRNAVTSWLSRSSHDVFNVPMLTTALGSLLCDCVGLDLGKALSNELQRREALGLLVVSHSEVVGLGRPPKMYKQRWK